MFYWNFYIEQLAQQHRDQQNANFVYKHSMNVPTKPLAFILIMWVWAVHTTPIIHVRHYCGQHWLVKEWQVWISMLTVPHQWMKLMNSDRSDAKLLEMTTLSYSDVKYALRVLLILLIVEKSEHEIFEFCCSSFFLFSFIFSFSHMLNS